ncbi:pupal cuticle protein Edg-78E [Drosophila guanche]|uniref:Blast:Pupal cuticle protein Edg-78E n=1 Tax=Drosophila guanche TaxID=7266 RepID=A0A3B0JU53_DROGU|nr:pupal cuticle protein Edg-78E [Drosophila guanche]SPP76251.1 blast:Pupal cuticle protein Edg-78E [Drosophila guanche]
MYKLLLLAALVGCALAAPINDDTITKFLSNADTDGTYGYSVEQASGIAFGEQGLGGVGARGSYSYISPEGIPVQVTYEADENGFRPQSELLPTPPPIPEAILQSIRFIQEHPTPEELADRAVRAQQI